MEIWLPPAAVVPQERGAEWYEPVDDTSWSDIDGFHRGFRSSFRLRAGKAVWFHFPFPTPSSARCDRVSLLWETEDGARVEGVIVHHGGMERRALTPPDTALEGEPVPFDPPEKWRAYYPDARRVLRHFAIDPVIETCFGVQLCVRVAASEHAGTVRFYGAGVRFIEASEQT